MLLLFLRIPHLQTRKKVRTRSKVKPTGRLSRRPSRMFATLPTFLDTARTRATVVNFAKHRIFLDNCIWTTGSQRATQTWVVPVEERTTQERHKSMRKRSQLTDSPPGRHTREGITAAPSQVDGILSACSRVMCFGAPFEIILISLSNL